MKVLHITYVVLSIAEYAYSAMIEFHLACSFQFFGRAALTENFNSKSDLSICNNMLTLAHIEPRSTKINLAKTQKVAATSSETQIRSETEQRQSAENKLGLLLHDFFLRFCPALFLPPGTPDVAL